MANEFENFKLADVLGSAAAINNARTRDALMQEQIQSNRQESRLKLQPLLAGMARTVVAKMDETGIPPGNPAFQAKLDTVTAPMRRELESMGFPASQESSNWEAIKFLAQSGGDIAKLHNMIQTQDKAGNPVWAKALDTGEIVETPYKIPIKNLPQGTTTVAGPDGMPQAMPIPGVADAVALIAAKKKAAEEGQRILENTTPEGEKYNLTGNEALGRDDVYLRIADAILPNLIQTESGGNPSAVSPKGAVGLTQIMPATGANPGMGVTPLRDGSPEENKRFGRDYLAALIRENKGDVQKALSAYNAGQGTVNQKGITNPGYVSSVLDRPLGQGTARKEQIQADIDVDKARRSSEAKEIGESTGKAKVALPNALANGQYAIDLLDKVKKHPGMGKVVGFPDIMTGVISPPGTEAKDFKVLMEQVKGKVFLEAFESLKGGGAITEKEGDTATKAIARLDTAQSEKSFIEAITELQGIISKGMDRASKKTGSAPSNEMTPLMNQVPKGEAPELTQPSRFKGFKILPD